MAHEDLTRDQHVEGSSDRAFGLVFAVVFLLIAGWPLFHGETPRWWAFGVAAGFGLVALMKPALFAGLTGCGSSSASCSARWSARLRWAFSSTAC